MEKRFKYSLAGAQRLENYRLDTLTAELAAMKESLQRKIDEHDSLSGSIGAAERALVDLITRQPMFWIESGEATRLQIADHRQRQGELNREMEVLNAQIADLIESIKASRQSQRLLEQHSDKCRLQFDREQEKSWEGFMDEMWLNRAKEQG